MTDTTNTNTNTQAAALAVRDAAAALARRLPLYYGSGEPADEDLAQAIEDLPLPDVDVTDLQAEVERLRGLLRREQQERHAVLDRLDAAILARTASQAQAEQYLAERDELRTQVHIITSERDELADCVQSLRARHAELAARLAEIEQAEPVQGPAWLTDEQISDLIAQTWGSVDIAPQSAAAFARAVAWMLGHCEDARGMVPERDELARHAELAARLAEIEAQEPVAWIEHELQGTGLRHLHFERRPNTLRDEVVDPVWTELIARPAPRQRVSRADDAPSEQLASRPACDWPGKCKHQHQRPAQAAAPERAEPIGGCGACGDACRSRGSCRLADESPRPADPRTPPPGCRLLGDYEPARAGDMAYIGSIGGRWRPVRPRMGIIGATMDELSDGARVLALARPCRCGPDGCPDSVTQAKGLTRPRLTPQDVDDTIKAEAYTTLPSGKVMVCELSLRNGFRVRGEAAVVNKANFSEGVGRKISRENARNKVWELEGYLLQQRLYDDLVAAQAAELA